MSFKNREVHGETLCWNCKNANCGCSWSREFKPVKGWKAIPTTIIGLETPSKSFYVKSCPEFKAEKRRRHFKGESVGANFKTE